MNPKPLATDAPTRREWLRWSIWVLLSRFALSRYCPEEFGKGLRQIVRHQTFVANLQQKGATITYQHTFPFNLNATPPGPKFLRWVFGEFAFAKVTCVQFLNRVNPVVGDDDLKLLGELSEIKTISLSGSGITDRGLVFTADCCNLESLDLLETRTTNAGLKHLGKLQKLKSLDLSGQNINNDTLSGILELSNLTSLFLADCDITSGSLQWVAKLPKLEDLWLSHLPRLNNEGLRYLSRNPSLRILYIKNTGINEAGLDHLTECSALSQLSINGANFSGTRLWKLQNLSSLKFITLGGPSFDDNVISSLKRLRHLEILSLDGTSISCSGIAELKDSLPNCICNISDRYLEE